ncbi:MAG: ribulose-phosphate 3-epimerase [Candidatus Thermoplasmatota archaeon]|nr:ribulose-phosphate 3-epimerase [Euryarchaeota archaeon]MBU4032042.1 ribulose-phosphate 3-epimerase [Candidatus Thermoplasmatota archaeon]MBU4070736.1 ribulose-phosphate 3-epimerase [Candidatus Thermoplasmatota archaeon]MBU4145168.1 ribulose-phosphate 3-epimerase [Candidatus Thermoplasmatota archaeon]MBU4591532.1 ribulose-phosphate 3-epimerase [Candidatus Thermoplasmatota archaeon]
MVRKIKISPSILSADLTNLGSAIDILNQGGADMVHLDVMDGNFVPNITFGPAFARELKAVSKIPFDTHLMITRPMRFAMEFIEAGSDWLTFHMESYDDPVNTIKHIRDLGAKVGMAINPCNPFSDLEEYLPELDMVVIMTVNPGFGGQKCMTEQFSKIAEARVAIDRLGLDIEIEVDGGINEHNVGDVVRAGATVFVAGSAVFRGKRGPAGEIAALKKAAGI